jgi:glucose-1-phosphate cytidylyltransferase
MKVVILAGGLGTRLSEETERKPKPMVEIGGRPILWHILKHYAHHGFEDFYLALGYKAEVVKRYFLDYHALRRDLTIDLADGKVEVRQGGAEDWRVHLLDTGLHTNTGGRLKALEPHLADGTFMLTYGDGVSDVDLRALLDFHRGHGLLATVTAVRPPARFGGLVLDGDRVQEFTEKPQIGEGWINGGFMVFEPGILDYLESPDDSLEIVALERAAEDGQLAAFRHDRFWRCMDTLRDLRVLEELWQGGAAPWRVWDA